jgi:DNA-binding MarR family transcriptional regulator
MSGYEVRQRVGAWVLRAEWSGADTQGGPQRLTIEPAEDATGRDVARGVTTTVLRRMEPELSRIVEKARETAGAPQGQLEALADQARAELSSGRLSGRYLALLSTLYVEASNRGIPAPVKWLGDAVGKTQNTVKDHLKRARKDGYLETTADRKAGGLVTEKARNLLE